MDKKKFAQQKFYLPSPGCDFLFPPETKILRSLGLWMTPDIRGHLQNATPPGQCLWRIPLGGGEEWRNPYVADFKQLPFAQEMVPFAPRFEFGPRSGNFEIHNALISQPITAERSSESSKEESLRGGNQLLCILPSICP